MLHTQGPRHLPLGMVIKPGEAGWIEKACYPMPKKKRDSDEDSDASSYAEVLRNMGRIQSVTPPTP